MSDTNQTDKTEWVDCQKFWPYRDFEGHWRWPEYTQTRTIVVEGKPVIQFRERPESNDEFLNRQI